MGLIWLTKAIYLNDYKIELEFNNNEKGIVNFENLLDNKIFLPLKEIETFKKFTVNSWTLEWENGADFSPEFLFKKLQQYN